MVSELKLKILINIIFWLPVVWFLGNQAFQILMSKKRLKILDRCTVLLKKIKKLNSNPDIDKCDPGIKKLRKEEKGLWRDYYKLLAYL